MLPACPTRFLWLSVAACVFAENNPSAEGSLAFASVVGGAPDSIGHKVAVDTFVASCGQGVSAVVDCFRLGTNPEQTDLVEQLSDLECSWHGVQLHQGHRPLTAGHRCTPQVPFPTLIPLPSPPPPSPSLFFAPALLPPWVFLWSGLLSGPGERVCTVAPDW